LQSSFGTILPSNRQVPSPWGRTSGTHRAELKDAAFNPHVFTRVCRYFFHGLKPWRIGEPARERTTGCSFDRTFTVLPPPPANRACNPSRTGPYRPVWCGTLGRFPCFAALTTSASTPWREPFKLLAPSNIIAWNNSCATRASCSHDQRRGREVGSYGALKRVHDRRRLVAGNLWLTCRRRSVALPTSRAGSRLSLDIPVSSAALGRCRRPSQGGQLSGISAPNGSV